MRVQLGSFLGVAALLSCVASAPLSGQEHASMSATASPSADQTDMSVAFRFGTLGLGLEVNRLFTNHIGARVGANYFSHTTTKSQTDISYDAKLKLQAFSALLDFYPGNRGSFHLSGGIITDPLKVDAIGQPAAGGTFTINDHPYTSAQVGTLTAGVKFPGVSPYLGLGFGTPAGTGRGLKFLFDLGVGIGKPKVSLNATGASGDPVLAADIKAQEDKTQVDLQKLKVYPVISFGLAYHF